MNLRLHKALAKFFYAAGNCNVWLLDLERARQKSKIKANTWGQYNKVFLSSSIISDFFENLPKNKSKKEFLLIKRQKLNIAGSKNGRINVFQLHSTVC